MILLDGKKIKEKKINELKEKVNNLKEKPTLAIISIGSNKPSIIYAKNKYNLAKEIGYNCQYQHLEKTSEEEIIKYINNLNNNKNIDGIIIELPLPQYLDKEKIINSIHPKKDIDAITKVNRLKLKNNIPYLIPCTAKAIIDLLEEYQINLAKKKITIIGKSILVGTPLYQIWKNNHLDVTLLDSKTKDITPYTKKSDIIVIAIGKKHFLSKEMIKKDAIIIDVGFNYINGKIYGDADFNQLKELSSYITPVPGGIGPITQYEAMNNLFIAYNLTQNK